MEDEGRTNERALCSRGKKRRQGLTLMSSRANRARCLEETSVIEGICGRLFVRKQASLRAERALVQEETNVLERGLRPRRA